MTRRYTVKIGDVDYVLDLAEVSKDRYSVGLSDGRVLDVTLVGEEDLDQKTSETLQPAEESGVPLTQNQAGVVKAPMPGVVFGVEVAVGTQVHRGDLVVVLEAMKMENAICAPHDGIVTAIRVASGDAVEHGAVLVELGG
ncbi:MAG: acetyl-CoA carboxylase biotin carboxyl carrier protein subunit [Propionibacteriaceae bacterium]|jgi:biotin carboxyl carrier protein|nr:acetyl-CoA carboxylase biotin carboxyl carrier protein subunit [Propionibacteriaceae bacterium]